MCEMCEKVFLEKASLSRHVRVKHEMVRFKCEMCEKAFFEKRQLNNHKLNEHDGIVWPCSLCPYKGNKPKSLHEHTKNVHSNDNRKHNCPQCAKMFTRKSRLSAHIRR